MDNGILFSRNNYYLQDTLQNENSAKGKKV